MAKKFINYQHSSRRKKWKMTRKQLSRASKINKTTKFDRKGKSWKVNLKSIEKNNQRSKNLKNSWSHLRANQVRKNLRILKGSNLQKRKNRFPKSLLCTSKIVLEGCYPKASLLFKKIMNKKMFTTNNWTLIQLNSSKLYRKLPRKN